jgi:LPS export ABC transporter protein LptC
MDGDRIPMTFKGMELASLVRVQKLHPTGLGSRGARALHVGLRAQRTPTARAFAWISAFATALVLAVGASADSAPSLDVEGMTFVASREDGDAVILHAERARFDTNAKKAYLLVVDAIVLPNAAQSGFAMRCDSGVVDLESNDFEATGNVEGHADSGELFITDWVRYDHAKGILFTEAPVLITDEGTTIRGGGFRYDVAERRFQMTGGARVVQTVKNETADEEKVP